MAKRIVALFALGIVLLVAVVGARQQATPTVAALLIEVKPNSVNLLSAKVLRGVIRNVSDAELVSVPRGTTSMLVRYELTPPGAGKATDVGWFHVEFAPTFEVPRGTSNDIVPGPPAVGKLRRVVLVKVPKLPSAFVNFLKVTPLPNTPPANWPRTPVGQAQIPPGIQ